MKNAIRLPLTAVALAALAACGSITQGRAVTETSDVVRTQAATYTNQTTQRVINPAATRERLQEVDAPWLAGRSVPLAREVTLSPVLRKKLRLTESSLDSMGKTKITALSIECNPSTYTLQRLARCITSLIGVPVHVKAEAYLAPAQFASRRDSGAGAAPAAAANGQDQTLSVAPVDMELNELLDLADATWSVNHRVFGSELRAFATA